jgi:lycopene cyclase domain-containing protein
VYTVWAATAVVAVLLVEVVWARTGILRRPAYWITIAITWAFQVPVYGWLTKLSAPIVIYNHRELTGVRFPWDIPIEDFAYGFALITLTLILWVRADARAATPQGRGDGR